MLIIHLQIKHQRKNQKVKNQIRKRRKPEKYINDGDVVDDIYIL
jgi:hypothetical protein